MMRLRRSASQGAMDVPWRERNESERGVPRGSSKLEVPARSAYSWNIPFRGTSGFPFLNQPNARTGLRDGTNPFHSIP